MLGTTEQVNSHALTSSNKQPGALHLATVIVRHSVHEMRRSEEITRKMLVLKHGTRWRWSASRTGRFIPGPCSYWSGRRL